MRTNGMAPCHVISGECFSRKTYPRVSYLYLENILHWQIHIRNQRTILSNPPIGELSSCRFELYTIIWPSLWWSKYWLYQEMAPDQQKVYLASMTKKELSSVWTSSGSTQLSAMKYFNRYSRDQWKQSTCLSMWNYLSIYWLAVRAPMWSVM